MNKIFAYPPPEKDWRFFSFFKEGKPKKLIDWKQEGGDRDSLLGGVNKHFFFKTKDLSEVNAQVAEVKGLLGKNKHFSNTDYTTHQVIALYLEVLQQVPSLSMAEFVSETAEESVRMFYSFNFMDLVELQLIIPETMVIPIQIGRFFLGGYHLQEEIKRKFPSAAALDIERAPATVLACPDFKIKLLPLKKYFGAEIPLGYYSQALMHVENKVLDELSATQAVASALLGDAIIVEELRKYKNLIRYACFSGGYDLDFASLSSSHGLPTTSSFVRLPEIFASLRLYAYPVTQTSKFTPIDQTLFTFISVLYKGFTFAVDGKCGDAFFQYIMALDLLLGGESNNNNNIQRRCAVIRMYCDEDAVSFSFAKDSAKKIYDVRSRYAHQAKQPSQRDLEEVQFLCTEVAKVLFFFRTSLLTKKDSKMKSDPLSRWFKDLDFIAATHEADQAPTLSQLQAAYLAAPETNSGEEPTRV